MNEEESLQQSVWIQNKQILLFEVTHCSLKYLNMDLTRSTTNQVSSQIHLAKLLLILIQKTLLASYEVFESTQSSLKYLIMDLKLSSKTR